MIQRSPILRFALEVLEHGIELALSDRPKDRKLAVLHLAQASELALKAAMVERNVSIYQRDGKTINHYEALKQVAAVWQVERIDMHSRLELLIDERNAIQHRYGDVDDVTLDYHLETAFRTLEDVLRRDFDTDLSDWIRDNVSEETWRRVRFIQVPEEKPAPPSEASLDNRSATLDLIDGFSRYEAAMRDIVRVTGQDRFRLASSLDLAIKTLASLEPPRDDLIQQLPAIYKLRNRVVHGEGTATDEEVADALQRLDKTLEALRAVDGDLVKRALATVVLGIRGARVLSWAELEQRSPQEVPSVIKKSADPAVPDANGGV